MLKNEFDNIKNLEILNKCQEMQKITDSKLNFNYNTLEQIFKNINNEVKELEEEVFSNKKDIKKIQGELGDVIFVLCNLANSFDFSAKEALSGTIDKMQRRFLYVENELNKEGKTIHDEERSRLDILWAEAKKHTKI